MALTQFSPIAGYYHGVLAATEMERDVCLKLLGTALLYATNVVTAHTAWL